MRVMIRGFYRPRSIRRQLQLYEVRYAHPAGNHKLNEVDFNSAEDRHHFNEIYEHL